jgi:hypothetical protein
MRIYNMIRLEDFESTYNNYENCPLEEEMLVWTGDSFSVEYVTIDEEHGTHYPANGESFTHYMRLPRGLKTQKFFEDTVAVKLKGEDKRYHIVSDAEFGWSSVFVEGFDTEFEAKARKLELSFSGDPYEVLTITDTLQKGSLT